MAPYTSDFIQSLKARDLPYFFGGRHFRHWTVIELRNLIKVFHPNAKFSRGQVKVDLCEQLIAIKGKTLSRAEQRAVDAIRSKSTITDARDLLNEPFNAASSRKRGASGEPDERLVKRERIDEQGTVREATILDDSATRECQICSEELPVALFPAVPSQTECNHKAPTTCIGCFKTHIESQSSTSGWEQCKCPEPDCNATLSFTHIEQYAPASLFTRYDNFLCRRLFEQMSEYYECANESCSSGGLAGDEATTNFLICEACDTKTCITCNSIWHADMSHDENLAVLKRKAEAQARRAQIRRENEASMRTIEVKSKGCPRCKTRIEKDGGCDHMICSRCDYHFCYRCLADYTEIRRSGNHMHAEHCRYYYPIEPRRSMSRTSSEDEDYDD